MHEMGVVLGIIEAARSAIPADCGAARVVAVHVQVGRLTGIVPESLRFCFDVAKEGTPLGGARLDIEQVPIRARCRECRTDFTVEQACFACPSCEGARVELVSGRELMVTSLELAELPEGVGACSGR